ncbi:hypothetical protein Ancab_033319 [Ancistrocladus abbreviatus]
MATGNRSGFMCSDSREAECDVMLGLKMQQQQCAASLNSMMATTMEMPHRENHMHTTPTPHRMSSTGGGDSGSAAAAAAAALTSICDVTTGASSVPKGSLQRPLLQQTSNFPSDSSSFTSWGEMAGGGGRTTLMFTASQRQELERQTAIYRYMMASVPVPPELLAPIPKHLASSEVPFTTCHSNEQISRGKSSSLELKYTSSGSSADPEPWRCKRTDGKKWRCSRDVAPDQKYCERHSHKGRPSRSRKPVESLLHSPNNTTTTTSATTTGTTAVSFTCPFDLSTNYQNSSLNQTQVLSTSQYNHTRYADWFMKREHVIPAATPYPHLDQTAQPRDYIMRGSSANFDLKHYHLSSQRKNELGDDQFSGGQSCLLPRQFLDDWSMSMGMGDNKDGNICEVTSKCGIISSNANLTLSMSGGMEYGNGREEAQLGTGFMGSDRDRGGGGCERPTPLLNWMNSGGSEGSWMSSPPGGPLAEALCLGIPSSAKGSTGAAANKVLPPHGGNINSSGSKSSRGESVHGQHHS